MRQSSAGKKFSGLRLKCHQHAGQLQPPIARASAQSTADDRGAHRQNFNRQHTTFVSGSDIVQASDYFHKPSIGAFLLGSVVCYV